MRKNSLVMSPHLRGGGHIIFGVDLVGVSAGVRLLSEQYLW